MKVTKQLCHYEKGWRENYPATCNDRWNSYVVITYRHEAVRNKSHCKIVMPALPEEIIVPACLHAYVYVCQHVYYVSPRTLIFTLCVWETLLRFVNSRQAFRSIATPEIIRKAWKGWACRNREPTRIHTCEYMHE